MVGVNLKPTRMSNRLLILAHAKCLALVWLTCQLLARELDANKAQFLTDGGAKDLEATFSGLELAPNTVGKSSGEFGGTSLDYSRASCQLVQVAHLLYHDGCQPKAIASFACAGLCPSYVQVSL